MGNAEYMGLCWWLVQLVNAYGAPASAVTENALTTGTGAMAGTQTALMAQMRLTAPPVTKASFIVKLLISAFLNPMSVMVGKIVQELRMKLIAVHLHQACVMRVNLNAMMDNAF